MRNIKFLTRVLYISHLDLVPIDDRGRVLDMKNLSCILSNTMNSPVVSLSHYILHVTE